MRRRRIVRKAAELDNRIPTVYVTLAKIHDALGKHDLALQEFQHALQLDPKSAAALGGLARSYENSGRIAEAEKTFQECSRDCARITGMDITNSAHFMIGRASIRRPLTAYNQASAYYAGQCGDLFESGRSLYGSGGEQSNLPLAEQALKKSIALSPGYPAYANLGLLYMQEKRYPSGGGNGTGAQDQRK